MVRQFDVYWVDLNPTIPFVSAAKLWDVTAKLPPNKFALSTSDG